MRNVREDEDYLVQVIDLISYVEIINSLMNPNYGKMALKAEELV